MFFNFIQTMLKYKNCVIKTCFQRRFEFKSFIIKKNFIYKKNFICKEKYRNVTKLKLVTKIKILSKGSFILELWY